MIYTLFLYTVVSSYAPHMGTPTVFYDWRPIATVEMPSATIYDQNSLLTKCQGVAQQLAIPENRYRCVRTK